MAINQKPYDVNRARLSEHPDQHSAEWTSLCKPFTPPCSLCDSKDATIATLQSRNQALTDALGKAEEALRDSDVGCSCRGVGLAIKCGRCTALSLLSAARQAAPGTGTEDPHV